MREHDSAEAVARKLKTARETVEIADTSDEDIMKAVVRKFKELLLEEATTKQLAETMAKEVGKPVAQGRGEVEACGYRISFLLNHIDEMKGEQRPAPNEAPNDSIQYERKGVCCFISAWNFPVLMLVDYIVPGLLTGNALIIKPSEFAIETALSLEQIFLKAGCPPGYLSICIGGEDVGKQLVTSTDIDSLTFIGSSEVGEKIARLNPPFRTFVMETGGNDGFYIDKSVNIADVVPQVAAGVFDMMGQNCDACERLYIHDAIFDQFCKEFVKHVKGFVVGDPLKEDTYIGPILRPESAQKLKAKIEDAVGKGAEVLAGGDVSNLSVEGWEQWCFFTPTVLSNCSETMLIVSEETFGPVVPLIRVPTETSSNPLAIAKLLNSKHGLTAGVFADPGEEGQKLAKSILAHVTTGTVYFNQCGLVQPWMPWAGRNRSGRGTILGTDGIRECFLRSKAWFL